MRSSCAGLLCLFLSFPLCGQDSSDRAIVDSATKTIRPEQIRAHIRFLADSPKDKHGAHVYSLSQFGLDADEERARYRDYRERFLLN